MELDELMSKHSDTYRFHGVKAETLSRLIHQSNEDNQIVLWGRVEDEDENVEYVQGDGEISTTVWNNCEMSCNEFVDAEGMMLVLEPVVASPVEDAHHTDGREILIRAQEWRVIGGVRPVFDEDEEIVAFEAFSLEEIGSL